MRESRVALPPEACEVEFYDTVTGTVLARLPGARTVRYEVPWVDRKVGWWRWRRTRRYYLTDNPVSARLTLYGQLVADYGDRYHCVQGVFLIDFPDVAVDLAVDDA